MGLKRQKKVSSALLSLSRSVQELTEENQSLKEDLDRVLSNSPTISTTKGTYEGYSPQSHPRRDPPGEAAWPILGGKVRAEAMGASWPSRCVPRP